MSDYLFKILGRRIVTQNTPRGEVRCEECGNACGYEYGSARWECQQSDRCVSCQAKQAAERIFANYRHEFAAAIRSLSSEGGE